MHSLFIVVVRYGTNVTGPITKPALPSLVRDGGGGLHISASDVSTNNNIVFCFAISMERCLVSRAPDCQSRGWWFDFTCRRVELVQIRSLRSFGRDRKSR